MDMEPTPDSPIDVEVTTEEPHMSESTKKRERKPQTALTREPGKSLFPLSRVQKIIKADKDIPIVAKEATFLISLATEEFIKRLCESAHKVAERSNRLTVQHKDLATSVRKADEFMFLEDIIPWSIDAPKKTTHRDAPAKDVPADQAMIDGYVNRKPPKRSQEGDDDMADSEDGA